MLRFWCARSLTLAVRAFTITLLPAVALAQPGQIITPASVAQTTKTDALDFGVGWTLERDLDSAGAVLEGRVYDTQGTLRERETELYSNANGSKFKLDDHVWDFNEKGYLTSGADFKLNPRGEFKLVDMTHYGLHGERTWEQVTDYQAKGIETDEWHGATNSWTKEFSQYKPLPAGQIVPGPQSPYLPANMNVGVLIARDFKLGGTYTGSLSPAKYAEGFKSVPGLSESTFPVEVYPRIDGSPEWSGLKVGLKGYGYSPVNPNGTFYFHIPLDYAGDLNLQVLQPNPVAGTGPSYAAADMGTPVVAPRVKEVRFPHQASIEEEYYLTEDLIDLWNEAFDLSNEIDDYYDGNLTEKGFDIGDAEEDLSELYDHIDYIESLLPRDSVVSLARDLARETREENAKEHAEDLTDREKAELEEYEDWADFLEEEAHICGDHLGLDTDLSSLVYLTPVVQPEGKLGVVRGPFSGDAYDTQFNINGIPITPLASTPYSYYYMPPPSLMPGLQNYQIESPGFPETIFPVFYMTLTMSADDLHLHKGQSTAYHVKLNGLNGLPGSAWSSPDFPSDLVGSSEWNAKTPDAQSPSNSRMGTITLEVTNRSPDVITMLNSFHILDAQMFAPSGMYQLDGSLGAIKDGSFNISGVARAYLQPEVGIGSTYIPPPQPTATPPSYSLFPSYGWSFNPATSNGSYFTPDCSSFGEPTGATGQASPGSYPPVSDTPGSSACMGRTFAAAFDRNFGYLPSYPLDNSTKTLSPEEKQQQEKDASKRADDAERQAWRDISEVMEARENEADVWGASRSLLDKQDRDDFQQAQDKLESAGKDHAKMVERYKTNPTPENKRLMEAAKINLSYWEDAYDRVERYLIQQFNQKDRAAWEAARARTNKAERDCAKAMRELRDAREARAELEKPASPATN